MNILMQEVNDGIDQMNLQDAKEAKRTKVGADDETISHSSVTFLELKQRYPHRNLITYNHHEHMYTAKHEKYDVWWAQEVASGTRCGVCWLRDYDCYCGNIPPLREKFHQDIVDVEEVLEIHVEFLLYYHYLEIGRSANTAHLLQALLSALPQEKYVKVVPKFVPTVKQLILVDVEEESRFWEGVYQEAQKPLHERDAFTSVLYPCRHSVPLSQWLNENQILQSGYSPTSLSDITDAVKGEGCQVNRRKTVRFVLLDGTYSTAAKIARYLEQYSHQVFPDASIYPTNPLAFVSLELESASEDGEASYVKSALAGIMYQPAKEKICSYQAMVIAMKDVYTAVLERQHGQSRSQEQIGHSSKQVAALFNGLIEELHKWIAYLLKNKIKFGKPTNKRGANKEVDNTPAEYAMEIIVRLSLFFSV